MPAIIHQMPPRQNAQRSDSLDSLEQLILAQMEALEAQLRLVRQIKNAPPTGDKPETGR